QGGPKDPPARCRPAPTIPLRPYNLLKEAADPGRGGDSRGPSPHVPLRGKEEEAMISLCAALLLTAPPPAKAPAAPGPDLAPPVKILAGGKPIDVEIGHAAPCVADFKGDGTLCLLVGQFGEGKLRGYPNA